MNIHFKNQKIDNYLSRLISWINKSENVTVVGKTFRIKPGRVIAAVVAALIAMIIITSILSIFVGRVKPVDINLDIGGDYKLMSCNSDVLMYNKQHIAVMNNKGKVLWKINVAMSQPVVETAGKYVLVYDLGGKNYAALYKKGKFIREYSLGNDIISAKVNKNGTTVFATDTVGYKGNIKIFDKKGRERFSWNSGDGYILDVALKDNGKQLAVAQFLSSSDRVSSCIQFIDITRKKVVYTAQNEDKIFNEIRYCNGKLLSVSDMELCGYSSFGRKKFTVSFVGKKPSKYSISNDNTLAFVTEDNRGNTVLELYSTRGRLKGKYNADSSINNFSVSDNGVIVARRREILGINNKGKQTGSYVSEADIKSIGIFGDGKNVLAIGTASVSVVRLK